MTTPAEAVEVLNRIHTADPTVLEALVNHRVPCNQAVVDDPTVQVGLGDCWGPVATVGLLGILNGIFGVREDGQGYIAAWRGSESGRIERFEVLS